MTREKEDPAAGPTRWMLTILALDPNASLRLSDVTGKWYVEASLHTLAGEEALPSGGTVHTEAPWTAVREYLDRLTDSWLVISGLGRDDQRFWRWNGAAFVLQPDLRAILAS